MEKFGKFLSTETEDKLETVEQDHPKKEKQAK